MAEDIVPGLLDKLTSDFQKSFQTDSTLVSLYAKVSDGTADQKDGEAFAQRLGQVLTDTFHNNVTPEQLPDGRMYYNIASRLITPMLETNHGLVNEVMRQIISKQNADAGIGLRYQGVDFDKDKAHGLVERAANYPKYEVVQNDVETGLTTFTQGVADEAVRKNASFQASAGLHPRIIRETDGDCCKWCLDLAGTYDYESAPPEVYARHANCGCSVEFRPGDGKRQDVWSKGWISDADSAKIEKRKEIEGLNDDRTNDKIEARKDSSTLSGMDKGGRVRLNINLFDPTDSLYVEAFSIEEIPGFEDVNAHGDPQHIEVGNTVMNANQFADYLRDSSKYSGQDLRLVSCSTGAGDNSFAQQLSAILHITVMAPDADTYYAPDEGTVFIGAETYNTGRWRIFKNGEELYE